MIAEIICVGTELLLGNTVNTNATYIARKCAECGLFLYHQQVVGDNEERLKEAFYEALGRSDIIITSGGLGPTNDDITKEVISEALGLKLYKDDLAEKVMKGYFERIGRTYIEDINNKQMLIPEGGCALDNKNGTAPAVMIETDKTPAKDKYPGKTIFLLPGPPRELIPLVEDELIPYFKKLSPEVLVSRMLKLTGTGESMAASKIDDILRNSENPTVAPYAKLGEVHFRVTAKAADEAKALALIEPVETRIKGILGDYIYTDDEAVTLEETLINMLRSQKLSLAAAESCTGGLLSGRLINVPGASDVFKEGFITYSNEAKMARIGVPAEIIEKYGAVSEECACAMAEGAAETAGTDVALSTTGIAGPDGGTAEKPVGLVYTALYFKGDVDVKRLNLTGTRQTIRELTCVRALDMLWRKLR